MLNSEQYIGVKRIVADIVHGAFTGALSVITAMVMTIRRFILMILTIGKRPATVSAFYKTGENLGSAIFLLSSAGSNLLLHMIENIFGNDRFMCILDTKPFFLWLADFLFVLVRNVGLLVVDAVADIGLFFIMLLLDKLARRCTLGNAQNERAAIIER